MKILLVDDSKIIKKLVGKMLESFGHEYVEASNGKEALDILDGDGIFDVTLLDWNMPELDGISFLEQLGSKKTKAGSVIMMTTENSLEKVKLALSKGASDYIMKPFDEEILTEKLASVLNRAV